MKITIHQPEFLPWLGFFDKIQQCEKLIFLDNVPFSKNYFQNRNQIRSSQGSSWITVPVLTKGKSEQLISEVVINNQTPWKRKIKSSIEQNYRKATYFDQYFPFLEATFEKEWESLSNLNRTLLEGLITLLGLKIDLVRASSLEVSGTKGDLLLNICKKVGANSYLSGVSGKDYLNEETFIKEGIEVTYQEFYHPIYQQLHEPFMPCLSIIDLLFNYGERSMGIITSDQTPRMQEVYQ